MPVDYDNFRNGNVELGTDWTVQVAGLHIFRGPSGYMGKDINWLRADNAAITEKIISRSLPVAASDPGVSIEWRFNFQFSGTTANDNIRFWAFANQAGLVWNAAGMNGYYIFIRGDGTSFLLVRTDGGGASATVINMTASWAGDTNEHQIIFTREVSGANRFWRVYLDGVLVGGPTNEATYANGIYNGVGLFPREAVAELYIQS
jgi:hypothetical protein